VIQRPLLRNVEGLCGTVGADDLTTVADNLGGNESNVANAATDVENSHTGLDTCVEEESARKGFKRASLSLEALQLTIGMP
jgi:hypothetical protein